MGASYNPLFQASHLCAGCHQGGGRGDLGRPKIDTFEEWRAWAAEREDERFRSCQDCHMPGGATRNVQGEPVDKLAWDGGSRRPGAVHSHRFEGTAATFAAPALDVKVAKRFDAGLWHVEVAVANVGAGHKIPTGTWSRHVAVGVWARVGDRWLSTSGGDRCRLVAVDAADAALAGGDWRDPAGGVLGVRPADPRYGVGPAPFWGSWKPEDVVDERLAPGDVRTFRCRFAGAAESEVPEVEVQIVHRRGAIGAGPASVPWPVRQFDPPPQTLWMRLVR
jgi:hypothetical protein